MDFLLSSGNTPFMVAIGIMLAFAVIELLSVSLGVGLSEMLDSLIPDMDIDVDADVAANARIDDIAHLQFRMLPDTDRSAGQIAGADIDIDITADRAAINRADCNIRVDTGTNGRTDDIFCIH